MIPNDRIQIDELSKNSSLQDIIPKHLVADELHAHKTPVVYKSAKEEILVQENPQSGKIQKSSCNECKSITSQIKQEIQGVGIIKDDSTLNERTRKNNETTPKTAPPNFELMNKTNNDKSDIKKEDDALKKPLSLTSKEDKKESKSAGGASSTNDAKKRKISKVASNLFKLVGIFLVKFMN